MNVTLHLAGWRCLAAVVTTVAGIYLIWPAAFLDIVALWILATLIFAQYDFGG